MKYLRHIIRFFSRNKFYCIASAIGLSIALTFIVLLLVYLKTEKTVDTHHQNAENIYRVLQDNECAFSPPLGNYLVDNYDGINDYCRTFCLDGVLKSDLNQVKSESIFYADANFFTLFDLPLKQGDRKSVLLVKSNILISEKLSKQLFGDENPVGKKLMFNSRLEYDVTGVFEEFDEHTHFKPVDVIMPFEAMADFFGGDNSYLKQYDWRFCVPALYVRASHNELSEVEKLVSDDLRKWYWSFTENPTSNLRFEPLAQVYMNQADYDFAYNVRSGNKAILKIIGFIVLAVSLIALINFINQSIAKTFERIPEMVIKRVNGAKHRHLLFDFALEQLSIVFSSLIITLLLIKLSIPYFNHLLNFNIDFYSLLQQAFLLRIIFLFYFSLLLINALVFLAKVMSTQNNLGMVKQKSQVALTQKGLMILQFAISITLIISLLFILKQKSFITNYRVGFNKTETLYVKLNREFKGRATTFRSEANQITGVQSASLCNGMPGVGIYDVRFEQNGKAKSIDIFNMDDTYFKTMGIDQVINDGFNDKQCWINQSAIKELEYDPEIGMVEIVEFGNVLNYEVAGILPDMNFHSLHQATRPAIFTKIDDNAFIDYLVLNIDLEQSNEILKELKSKYEGFSINFPFDYAFINERLNQAYEKENRNLKLISWFSLFGIILSLGGMLALTTIVLQNKTREIGIRKVNGAKAFEVLGLIIKQFVLWVIVAFVVAVPISYAIMVRWLESFSYKISLSWWVFAGGGVLVLCISMLAISFQTVKAANQNPVDALRYE